MMVASLALELVLFLCTVGITDAAPRGNARIASPGGRHHRAIPETTVEVLNTAMPNHLPEGWFATVPAPDESLQPTINVTATTAHPENNTELFHIPVAQTTSVALSREKTTLQTTMFAALKRTTNSSYPKRTTPPPVPTTNNWQAEVQCNCSSEGASDPEDCDRATGECVCLPGYGGAQCEDCVEGHFSNTSSGCLPCGCDSYGAVGNLCDSSGACVCKPGVSGPKCDDCQSGFFRFSSTGCQPCHCNGQSSYCHPQSGMCLNCQGDTRGFSCEECQPGFYRRPGTSLSDSCLRCPCPATSSTLTCHINSTGQPACDQCLPEYRGPDCSGCQDGFYSSGGACLPCDCSGNEGPGAQPRLCNPETGHCLSCANNTAGQHCELCAPGFSGDALARTCTQTAVRILPTPEPGPTTTATASQTAPPGVSAMSSTADLLPETTSRAQLSSLGSPADNATTTLAAVSWTQFNIIVLAVIVAAVAVLMGVAGGVYTYREYQNRKLNAPFWTIELKEDNISFSSYHDSIPNADVSGLLEDEASEVALNGQLALGCPSNIYKA